MRLARRQRTRVIVVVILVGVVAAVGALVWDLSQGTGRSGPTLVSAQRPHLFPWNGPIPGVKVDPAVAAGLVPFAVPQLPTDSVPDPCSGALDDVRLLETWVSSPSPNADNRFGAVYSDGIWLSVGPMSDFSPDILKGGELRPVETAFAPEDQPRTLATVIVRGHVGWAKDLASDFSCKTDSEAIVDAPPANATPGMTPRAQPLTESLIPRGRRAFVGWRME
jgi:hypothetical protein